MRIADTLLTDNDRRKLDLFVFLREMPTSAREYALERRIPYSTALRLYKELRTDVKSLCPDATKRELDELTPLTINDYRRFLYSSSVTGQLIDQGFTHDVPSMADFAKSQHISVITLKRRIAPYISELERHNIWFDGGKLTLSVSEPVTESIQYSFFKTTEISIPQKMTPAELTILEQIASFYEKCDLLQQDHAVQADRRIIISIWIVRLRNLPNVLNNQDQIGREHALVHPHADLNPILQAVQAGELWGGTVSQLHHAIKQLDYLVCYMPYQVQYLSAAGHKKFMQQVGIGAPKMPKMLRPIKRGDAIEPKIARIYFRIASIAVFMDIFGVVPFFDGGIIKLENYAPESTQLTALVSEVLPTELLNKLSSRNVAMLVQYAHKHLGMLMMQGWRTTVYMSDEFTPLEHDVMSNWFWGLIDIKPQSAIGPDSVPGSFLIYQHHCDDTEALMTKYQLEGMQWISELPAAVNAGRLCKKLRIDQQSIFSV